ncbi:hypothetical protein NPIL_699152 [Nephila pilipes]|uniref:Uncharacterized protein n=1 Tax=Nephila pilipes TaxID=299642 RepID=A0A8X6NEE7_NEPPI|nr:hypothetical protein NPIL_699152 [Nephila pilipes]
MRREVERSEDPMMGFPTFLLVISSLLLLSTVSCNHDHHDHHNQRKEYSSSEPTPDFGKSEATEESVSPLVLEGDSRFGDMESQFRISLGFLIGIPIVGILIFVFCCYCIFKCCCGPTQTPGVIVMQNNPQVAPPPPPGSQLIVQQPMYQHVPPSYDMQQQRWAQPSQPPQWTPHPMDQHAQYSPNSAYDNPNYTGPAVAPPPPYNTGKY